jgi:hypothetical protein
VSLSEVRLDNAWLVLADRAALFVWAQALVVRTTTTNFSSAYSPDGSGVSGDDRSLVVLDGDLWLENYDPLRDQLGRLVACILPTQDDDADSKNDDNTNDGSSVGDDGGGGSDDEYFNATAPYHLQVESNLSTYLEVYLYMHVYKSLLSVR